LGLKLPVAKSRTNNGADSKNDKEGPNMKFRDLYISREFWFVIGIELESQRYYIQIPVPAGHADIYQYYEIEKFEFEKVYTDVGYLNQLAQKCKDNRNEERRMK
jgi:hypothetical protein